MRICNQILRAAQDDTQGCYDSLLNGEYTAETTEDYGDEVCNLPYPDNKAGRKP